VKPIAIALHKFVQTRTLMVQLFEQEPHYRQIFLDGREHPKDAGLRATPGLNSWRVA